MKRIGKYRHTLLIAAMLFALILLFSFNSYLSEAYMTTVYPVVATILSFISGLFPFSLYDIFLICAILWLLFAIVFSIARKKAFSHLIMSLLRFVTVIVVWFYFSWGIAYFRKDFYHRCDVEQVAYDSQHFKQFAVNFIDKANHSYVNMEDVDKQDVRKQLEVLYQQLREPLNIKYPAGRRRVKPMLFQSIYSKTGVSGYFGPFFNEIHVNDYSLDLTYPFTLAHEMAHQFGVALESEANMYAFIVCASSNDARLKYSAYASVLRYVLNNLYRSFPDEYEMFYSSVRPEIIADMRKNSEHWLAARSEPLSNAQDKMYDAYLKTNKVASGQMNYSEVVSLLVSSWDKFSPFFSGNK